MRMLGWCEVCHRTKNVTVNLGRWAGHPIGICDSCRDEQERKRKEVRR